MIASILQLSGGILVAIMTFMRRTSKIQMYASTPLLLKDGQISPQLLTILKETYLFRVGLIYLCIGYFLQIANFSFFEKLELRVYENLLIGLTITIGLTLIGFYLAYFFAKNSFSKISPFDPKKANVPIGSIWLKG